MTSVNPWGPVLTICMVAGAAVAQDSVSTHAGLPGDAPDPYGPADQCAAYVLDLVPIQSSWGNGFAVGPVLKLPRSEPGVFFNNLPGGSAISARYSDVALDGTLYSVWSTPGQGVSASDNASTTQTESPIGSAIQFAVLASDFAPVGGVFTTGVSGAVIAIDPAEQGRAYVQRRIAAVSGDDASAARASLSIGSIDEQGLAAIRADAFGATGASAIVGSNLFAIDLLGRDCASLNRIDLNGGSDSQATSDIARSLTTITTPPALLPAAVASGSVIASDFAGQLRFGPAGATSVTTTHLAASSPLTTTDHRGTAGVSPAAWFTGSDATGSILSAQEPTGPSDVGAFGVSLWGIDAATGGVTTGSGRTLLLPAAGPLGGGAMLTDNLDGYAIGNAVEPGSDWSFDHFESQASFRGGNGPVAVNTDASGRLLIAAQAAYQSFAVSGADSPVNAIAVARIDTPGSSPSWTLAAWADSREPDGGKAITDGDGGIIGYLDAPTQGPSISSPAIDASGNVWFVASVRLENPEAPGTFEPATALCRAVYDPAALAFELERVLATGDAVTGLNSDTLYEISSIELADRNSISSGAMNSGSLMHEPWLGGPVPGDPESPESMGGLVLSVGLTYDTSGDGQFDGSDEAYTAVLLVAPDASSEPCPADLADASGFGPPDGLVDFGDFFALSFLVGPCPGMVPGCAGDLADDIGFGPPDGQVSFGDFFAMSFFVGPCP